MRTVRADLDEAAWPDLGSPDLAWASASMHHMADPDRALRTVHDMLAPGGLFAVVELAGHPRFLPESAPQDRPGLEERVHTAADRLQAAHMSHRGADRGPKPTAAGFRADGRTDRTGHRNVVPEEPKHNHPPPTRRDTDAFLTRYQPGERNRCTLRRRT